MRKSFGLAEQYLGCFRESVRIGGLVAQCRFRFEVAPGFVRDSSEGKARLLDAATLEFQRRSDGHQRKGVGQAIADFQIAVVGRETPCRELDCSDDFVRLQVGIDVRRIAGQPVEVGKSDSPLSGRTRHVDYRFEGRKRDAHVGRMRCNA